MGLEQGAHDKCHALPGEALTTVPGIGPRTAEAGDPVGVAGSHYDRTDPITAFADDDCTPVHDLHPIPLGE